MARIYNRSEEKQKRRQLRRNMPRAEVRLWSKLKERKLGGVKFRRQYSVGRYVLDFYCPEMRLAIELDGDTHFRPGADVRDEERQRLIESYGIRFLRFRNDEVQQNMEGVLGAIEKGLRDGMTPPCRGGRSL